ncbi:LysR substrate-binding domain-containing protein, partial [Pseudonocardia sp. McavD-2-B]|uniref:LysR substrate-binding domain-containing protein n=2 Tax=unclassified Pseudonocardia TaxID=2619320 RepID=UPI002096A32B
MLGFPHAPPDDLDGRVLVESPLVAAVAADDPFAGRAAVTLDELAARALICLPRGHGLRAALDAALAARSLTARVGFESGAMTLLLRLAARGAGVAVVPEPALGAAGMAALARPPVAVPITPEIRTRLHLVLRSGGPGGPAAQALLESLLRWRPARGSAGDRHQDPDGLGDRGAPRDPHRGGDGAERVGA